MDNPLEQELLNFFSEKQNEARRVFHGRGHLYAGYEHVCLDWYGPVLAVLAYAPIENIESLLAAIAAVDVHSQIETILLQKRFEKQSPTEVLKGELPEKILVHEDGLIFEVHPAQQQNSGLFMDARTIRNWITENSKARNVLNLFAYTCSFSVAAIAGKAKAVTNVDMSKTSMRWGLENHRHNKFDTRCVNQIPYNVFTSWGRIKQFGRYDMVIIDPPTRQRGSFDVAKNYPAVIKKLSQLCCDGADVVATLNSPFLDQQFLLDNFSRYGPNLKFMDTIAAAPEFEDKFPEKALKICHFKFGATHQ